MTGHDILRSLARLVAELLPTYEVTWFPTEDVQRPTAQVVQSTPSASSPHGSRFAEVTAGYAVVALPARGASEAAGAHEAGQVAETLLLGLTRGQDPALIRGERGHPQRMAVWSYEGIGPDQAATVRAGVARIAAPNVQALPDPREPRAWLITADLRIEWSRYVGVPDPRPLVGSVGIDRRGT